MANRRVGSLFAVAALVLATVTPGLVPAFASAAQISERSVQLSSASKSAQGVEYKITFTPVAGADAVVFDFCENTPLIGATCVAPAGFNASAATVSGTGFAKSTEGTANDANTVVVAGDIAETETVISLESVTNPSAAKPLYLRIATYNTEVNAGAYTSEDLGNGVVDTGSAAASITDTVGVSAAVLESLTFCVAANQITGVSCTRADAADLDAPVLKLGEVVTGNVRALNSNAVSEGSLFSQLSTNAANGAVVNLKSSTTCGGLKRLEATACDIVPANGTGGITNGQARFGVKVASATGPAGNASEGAYQIAVIGGNSYYSDSVLKLNYVDANTGVSSPYGDPLLDTNGAPVNNKNVELIFGASAANNTPAGTYATDLSLIATGKF